MPVSTLNKKDLSSSRKRCVKVFLGGSKFAKGLCTGSEERQVISDLCLHIYNVDVNANSARYHLTSHGILTPAQPYFYTVPCSRLFQLSLKLPFY